MKDRQVKSTNMLQVYDRLRQSPVTLDALHGWMKTSGIDVSKRTLYRYLNGLLDTVNFQGEKLTVYNNGHGKKVWKIETTGLSSTSSNINAFDYQFFKTFLPKPLLQTKNASYKKIVGLLENSFSDSGMVSIDAMNPVINHSFAERYTPKDTRHLKQIMEAIAQARKIRMQEFVWDARYLPTAFKSGILVIPLNFLFHHGSLYLCVFSEMLDKICLINLSDIISVDITDETFKRSAFQNRLKGYLSTTFGIMPNADENVYEIEIEFAVSAASFVSRMKWHRSQSFSRLENGNLLMKMRCGLNSELVSFVIYFHHNAKVILPYRLRAMVMGRLQDTLKIYNSIDTSGQEFTHAKKQLDPAFQAKTSTFIKKL